MPVLTLIANGICLVLLQRSKSEETYMKASMMNDVIINLGIIAAAAMVNWTEPNQPDLTIGIIVFDLIIQGTVQILKLGK